MIHANEVKQRVTMLKQKAWNMNRDELVAAAEAAVLSASEAGQPSVQVRCQFLAADGLMHFLRGLGYQTSLSVVTADGYTHVAIKGWAVG